jgi:hypothetical protein
MWPHSTEAGECKTNGHFQGRRHIARPRTQAGRSPALSGVLSNKGLSRT